MINKFDSYLKTLCETPLDEHTEHTGRAALQSLLKVFANGTAIQHEPKRAAGGAPDFKVTRAGAILGYVEVKAVGADLDKVLKSEQIKRYKDLSGNLIVTNYLDFIWIDGDFVQRATLLTPLELESGAFRLDENAAQDVSRLLLGFFSTPPLKIGRSQDLAVELAKRSKLLREYLTEELIRQSKRGKGARLHGLYQVFRDQVFHDLKLPEFADAFAQMLAYGLFLARLNSGANTVDLGNARDYVPGSFKLIRELVEFLNDLKQDEYRDVRWVVEEVLSIVNAIDLAAIHEDLSYRNRKMLKGLRAKSEAEARLFERDPFIYFYEDYLSKHNSKERETRGVYYTPPPVVNFIVRAIDDILKDPAIFNIRDGLADSKVTVLDFACGTGTFLVEVFERIFETIGGPDAGKADRVVRDHILKNIYGFEYLIAPYTIAHLKLSQYLADKKHALKDGERLQIYLTNTLEPIEPQRNFLLPELSNEVEAAQNVKDKPILVITGNPPYSGHSRNMGNYAKASISAYKFVDGKPLGERNPKWLQDDYVKFLRFAQMKMDALGVERGIVGVITNHSWLDNPTFRGMRQSLMQTFDQIYVLDLHGNAKKKECAPDGGKDENVFDIEQGVAISLFVKKPGCERGVWRADLWGEREAKYESTARQSKSAVDWVKLEPKSPKYLFSTRDNEAAAIYETFPSISEMFALSSVGVVTARDHLSIHFTEGKVIEIVRDFAELDAEEARRKYELGADVEDWRVTWAQDDIRKQEISTKFVKPILYRPFDSRFTYYTGQSRGFICRPRSEVMRHMLGGDNIALITSRLTKDEFSAIATDNIAAHKSGTRYDISFCFPLRTRAAENLDPDFRAYLAGRYDHNFTAEEILGYIYAVLHAPTYRARYAEFLRMDFPRVSFPESAAEFEALSRLGWQLVQAHLLRDVPHKGLAAYHGKGDHAVEKPRYDPLEQAIRINATQYFAPVPQEVWDFHIGGYQVIAKYLKSRAGRTLSLDEIEHIAKVADCLAFTIQQMQRIDVAYLAAFPSGGK